MNFISENEIKLKRRKRTEARELIVRKAKKDYSRQLEKERKKHQLGEHAWMLPSVSRHIAADYETSQKRSKGSKSNKSKKRKHKKFNEVEGEWVEKKLSPTRDSSQSPTDGQQHLSSVQRDNWMLHPRLLDDLSRHATIKEKSAKEKLPTPVFDVPGQHPKELNPYWKDGGTGVPKESVTPSSEGLFNPSDRFKSELKVDASVSSNLLSVVKERWKLSNIKKIEKADNSSPSEDRSEHRKDFAYPSTSSMPYTQQASSLTNRNWVQNESAEFKKDSLWTNEDVSSSANILNRTQKYPLASKEYDTSSKNCSSSGTESDEESADSALTKDDHNVLGSKILRAELMGDNDLVEKLKQQLERAKRKDGALVRSGKNLKGEKIQQRTSQPLKDDVKESTILLSNVKRGGVEIPLRTPDIYMPNSNLSKRERKGKKVKTYSSSGSRERYFADDNDYNLKFLVQREKEGNVEDYDKMLARITNKYHQRTDPNGCSLDEMFESSAANKFSPIQQFDRERRKAISEQHKIREQESKCCLCIDSKTFKKHLLVALGVKVYLSLPSHRPLTDGHCFIIPMQHETAATSLDEDVIHEIKLFRQALTKMFNAKGMTTVFFEISMNLRRRNHMCIQCIPISQDIGDLCPIYFQKAIMEADAEWTQNKKLIPINEKGLRNAIPRGFPYFSVEFGLTGGYAHVIEDENLFPEQFAEEIIGGMLDIEPHLWRRPPMERFELQQQRVVQFSKSWKPYDWTQKIER